MEPIEYIARREFFCRTAGGLGWIALGEMLAKADGTDPMLPKQPHYPGKAKSVIFMFMSGAPSQIDLLDPKPRMQALHGQPMPLSVVKDLKDDLIRGSATVMASPRKFQPYGKCGTEFS